ncbi:MAG: sigma-54-dependent Fis family transcriptional regulator [Bacteroidetes bacterium]|nr:sigma-54-dependent Fis family transcriptional regulator [Bacteroidota bacterium]
MKLLDKVIRLLVIEDEEYDVKRIKKTIAPYSSEIQIVDIVSNGKAALDLVQANPGGYDVVITDYQISGGIMGDELIKRIRILAPALQVIVVTKMTINLTNFDFAAKLIQAGAFWYCTKYPGDIEDYIYQPTDFILSIVNAWQKKRLEEEQLKSNRKLTKNIENILSQKVIVGESTAIKRLREDIRRSAQNSASIFITGPSGTGKELVANNIHYTSDRRLENFVAINCGSIPFELVESELFGYTKGSFTGANSNKQGLFEIANNGTIFLDEVTELPLSAQVKMLRVLQEGELEKIGRTGVVKVDVRVIAATNRNIEEEIAAKRFREDLYYRLNVVQIQVPALKDRREDIDPLFTYFLDGFKKEMSKDEVTLSDEARTILTSYNWPGNVRELKNVAQRLLFNEDSVISAAMVRRALGLADDHVVNDFRPEDRQSAFSQFLTSHLTLRDIELEFRREYVTFIRERSESDAEAAKKLGIAAPNYSRMCKELGLK